MAYRVYCYPNSDVLKNKLNIRDNERLHDFERQLTMLRLMELIEHPIKGKFDLKHLQMIHKYIYQDIYEWAGEIRKVDIAKEHMFCNVKFLNIQANEIFGNLKREECLSGLDRESFIKRLAFYFSENNALHPFREGNGRAQREFIRVMAIRNGYKISFAKTSEKEMLNASKKSFLCDYEAMEKLIAKCISKRCLRFRLRNHD